MGQIARSANRELGWRLGKKGGPIIAALDVLFYTLRFSFRFITGRPVFGDDHRKTDATFRNAGTIALKPKERPPSKWSYLPEWKRAAIRIGTLALVIGLTWLWFHFPPGLFVGSAFLITVPLRRAWKRWTVRAFRRQYIEPLQKTLAPILAIPPGMPVDKWLRLSPDMPGIRPGMVKPMGKVETRLRLLYGRIEEPIMNVVWWIRGDVNWWTKAPTDTSGEQ